MPLEKYGILSYGTPARAAQRVAVALVGMRRGLADFDRRRRADRPSALTSAALVAAVLVLLDGGGSAAGAKLAEIEATDSSHTATIALDQQPPCLNVLLVACNTQMASWISGAVLAGAFRVRPDSSFEPVLVEGVEVARQPFTLTYRIRPEAVWSDGVPVTADDFVFTYETIVAPGNAIASRAGYELVSQVEKLGAKTVRFHFSAPYAMWRWLFDRVLPKHVLADRDFNSMFRDGIADPDTHEPVGSGPFLVWSWNKKASSLTLVRNDRWWGSQAGLASIGVRFVPDTNTQFELLRGGQVDAIFPQPQQQIAELRSLPDVTVQDGLGTAVEHLDFNLGAASAPLVRERWFRQVVARSFDRDAIAAAAYAAIRPNLPVQHNLGLLSTQQGYEPVFDGYRYDPDAVAAVMLGHGCERGADGIWTCGGNRASVKLLTTLGNAQRELVQQLIKQQAAVAGIEIVPEAALDALTVRLPARNYESILFAWVLGLRTSNEYGKYACDGLSNHMGYCSQAVSDLLRSADGEVDAVARANLLNQANVLLAEDAPSIPLYLRPAFLAHRNTLQGPAINPPGSPLWNVEDWTLVNVTPGSLDPVFGGARVTASEFEGAGAGGLGVALQADGKIVVVGGGNAGPDTMNDDYIVVRYKPNGLLDSTFGGDGRVVTDFGGPVDEARDAVVQPDGKIVVAGWSRAGSVTPGDFSVARYLESGALDPTFGGGDGLVTTDMGGDDFVSGIALQPDGKIVLAGGTASRAVVARLLPDGTLDSDFDGDGKVVLGLSMNVAWDVVLGAGGAIVLVGARCDPTCVDAAAARLHPGGAVDTGFDGDGIAHVDFGSSSEGARGVALLPDGDIVVSGFAGPHGALARLNGDGALDTAFGTAGRVVANFGVSSTPSFEDVIASSSGRLVVGGTAWGSTTQGDLMVARYLADGTPDTSFSEDGRALADLDAKHQNGAAVVVQPDSKIVVAGQHVASSNPLTWSVAVARFLADDPLPPETVVAGPAGTWARLSASFGLSSVPGGAAFECRVNGGAWAACGSPFVVATVVPGSYLYEFRAVNGAGPDATPVSLGLRVVRPFAVDWDGDGKANVAVWRPEVGGWYVSGQATSWFGLNGDVPLPGQWDADPELERAVWRPQVGGWYVEGQATQYWGALEDVPVSADWDGDGELERIVWRPAHGGWYVQGVGTFYWGQRGDVPVLGDYDGDPQPDLAVYRHGAWHIEGQATVFHGLAGDVPVPADWNGDGKTDIAVYRPSNSTWYVKDHSTTAFGLNGDIPLVGDFDSDPAIDRAIWRPDVGGWYVEGSPAQFFGLNTDIP